MKAPRKSSNQEVSVQKTRLTPAVRQRTAAPEKVSVLKDWNKLFAAADTAIDTHFHEWDVTNGDGIN
jgi:hypothetical protein